MSDSNGPREPSLGPFDEAEQTELLEIEVDVLQDEVARVSGEIVEVSRDVDFLRVLLGGL